MHDNKIYFSWRIYIFNLKIFSLGKLFSAWKLHKVWTFYKLFSKKKCPCFILISLHSSVLHLIQAPGGKRTCIHKEPSPPARETDDVGIPWSKLVCKYHNLDANIYFSGFFLIKFCFLGYVLSWDNSNNGTSEQVLAVWDFFACLGYVYMHMMFSLECYGNAVTSVMFEQHFKANTVYKVTISNILPLLLFHLYYCTELILHSIRK